MHTHSLSPSVSLFRPGLEPKTPQPQKKPATRYHKRADGAQCGLRLGNWSFGEGAVLPCTLNSVAKYHPEVLYLYTHIPSLPLEALKLLEVNLKISVGETDSHIGSKPSNRGIPGAALWSLSCHDMRGKGCRHIRTTRNSGDVLHILQSDLWRCKVNHHGFRT